jgi:hypothetical protein
MLFKKEDLQDMVGTTISNEVIGRRRWVIEYERIFEFENKFYRTVYEVGSTEIQDQQAYEYDDDMIECNEVFPVEVKTIVYKTAKEING